MVSCYLGKQKTEIIDFLYRILLNISNTTMREMLILQPLKSAGLVDGSYTGYHTNQM